MSALAHRAPVHAWIGGGASERRTLAAIGIGTSALSYCLRDDNNFELRWRQGALAPWRLGAPPSPLWRWDDRSQVATAKTHREIQAWGVVVPNRAAASMEERESSC
ncbi:hypothetical protein JH270_15300 [Xanthomonas campestris pv. raphani]|nr:hypothetical protein JH270_15300 [Xanthomonas campestris pv. raphani]